MQVYEYNVPIQMMNQNPVIIYWGHFVIPCKWHIQWSTCLVLPCASFFCLSVKRPPKWYRGHRHHHHQGRSRSHDTGGLSKRCLYKIQYKWKSKILQPSCPKMSIKFVLKEIYTEAMELTEWLAIIRW